MNCAYHTEAEHAAFCIKCGKALCAQCVRHAQSGVYCESCLPGVTATARQSAPQTIGGSSPEAAFVLGLIPGVGAIFNAEYFKAALHLLIFGTLLTIVDSVGRHGETLFGLLAFGFYVYMPFEAYFTAKKRKLAREGIVLVTPFDQLNEQLKQFGSLELWGGVLLVLVGGLFLLDNFDLITLDQVARFWPVLLIVVGILFIQRFLRGKQS